MITVMVIAMIIAMAIIIAILTKPTTEIIVGRKPICRIHRNALKVMKNSILEQSKEKPDQDPKKNLAKIK